MFPNTSSTSHNLTSFIDPASQSSSSLDLNTVLADLHLDYEDTSTSSSNNNTTDPSSFSFPSISQSTQRVPEKSSSFQNSRRSSLYNSTNDSLKVVPPVVSARSNHQHSWSLSAFPTPANKNNSHSNFSGSLFANSESNKSNNKNNSNNTSTKNNILPELTLDYDLDTSSSSININASNSSSATAVNLGSFNSLRVLKHRYSHSASRSISNPLFLSEFAPSPSANNNTTPINDPNIDVGIEIDDTATSNPSSFNLSSVPLLNDSNNTLWNTSISGNPSNQSKMMLMHGNSNSRSNAQQSQNHHKRSWSIASFPSTVSSSSTSATFSQQLNSSSSGANSTSAATSINDLNKSSLSRRASSISITSHNLLNHLHLNRNNGNHSNVFLSDIHDTDKISSVRGSANNSIILEEPSTQLLLPDVMPDVVNSNLELNFDLDREMEKEFEKSNSSVGTIVIGSDENIVANSKTAKNSTNNKDIVDNTNIKSKDVSSMMMTSNNNSHNYSRQKNIDNTPYVAGTNNMDFKLEFGYIPSVSASGLSVNGNLVNSVVPANSNNNSNTIMRPYNYHGGLQYQYNNRYNPQNPMTMTNAYLNNNHLGSLNNKLNVNGGPVQYMGNSNMNMASINGGVPMGGAMNINGMNNVSSIPQLVQQLPKNQQHYALNFSFNGSVVNNTNNGRVNMNKNSNRNLLANYHHNNHHNKNNKRNDDKGNNGASFSNNGASKFMDSTIDEFEGQIYSLCKDQHGCRFLQKQLDIYKEKNVSINHAAMIIFNEIQNYIVELMTNQFGNYLIQKLFDQISSTQRLQLLKNCRIRYLKSNENDESAVDSSHENDLIKIALDSHGTRALQRLIEVVSTQDETDLIITSCKNHIVQLSRDLNGNHVVQKMLTQFNKTPSNVQFIFDSATENCLQIATHRHGCCVLQRCLDYGSHEQFQQLSSVVAQNCLVLAVDPFGNYVVQYVLSKGEESAIVAIVKFVLQRLVQLSTHKFGSNVIEKILRIPKLSPLIIEEILKCGGSAVVSASGLGASKHGDATSANSKKKNGDTTEAEANSLSNAAPNASSSVSVAGNAFLNRLLHDPYGNYVLQTALDVAKRPDDFNKLADIIRPCLPSVRNTVHGRRISSKLSSGSSSGKGK